MTSRYFISIIHHCKIQLLLYIFSYFPIAIYGTPEQDKYEQLNDLGINTIFEGYKTISDSKLSAMEKLNLNLILNTNTIFRDATEIKEEVVKQQINKYGNYKNLVRYYGFDEPTEPKLPYFAKLSEYYKKYDPSKPIITNYATPPVYPDYKELTSQARPNELLVDIYPISTDAVNPTRIRDKFDNHLIMNLDRASKVAKEFDIPLWYTAQVHSWDDLRNPKPTEISQMVYLALSRGTKGIHYFLYDLPSDKNVIGLIDKDGKPNEKYYAVKKINNELNILSPILINLKHIKSCNSQVLNKPTENFVLDNQNWQFEDFQKEDTSIDTNNKLSIKINRQKQGRYFNFNYNKNIDITKFPYLEFDYDILNSKSNDNIAFGFGVERKGFTDNTILLTTVDKHNPILNIKDFNKGLDYCLQYRLCTNPDVKWEKCNNDCNTCKCSGTNVNKLRFFFDLPNNNDMLDIKFNYIGPPRCKLGNIKSITGDFDVSTFVSKDEYYVMLVNRDIDNAKSTDITFYYPNVISNKKKTAQITIEDQLTKEKLSKEITNQGTFTFRIPIYAGGGRLFKVNLISKSKFLYT